MEEKATLIETLVEKAETYAKTNINLLKLQSVDKLSDIVASVVTKIVFVLIISLIAILVNFGLAYWIGGLLGETSYGFFIVAFFYIFLALIIYFSRKNWIGIPVKNAVIKNFLEEKKSES